MALNLGIIGLPKSGKTTLFNALTGSHAQTSSYSSGEEPNVAVVKVPDPRPDVLTAKPVLVVANLGEESLDSASDLEAGIRGALNRAAAGGEDTDVIAIPAQLEMEIGQLSPEDAAEFRETMGLGPSRLGEVVSKSYSLLGLISFLTGGEDEVRAWTIRRGTNAQRAAGAIHTDLERGLIRAEVVHYDDLVAAGSLAEARRHGHLRSEGKTYVVKDGDVVHVLFS